MLSSMHRTAFLFVALLSLNAAQPAALSLTGCWETATQKLDDGTDYKIYFQLQQNGNKLTGRVIHPWGFQKVGDGAVNGGSFRFVQHFTVGIDFRVEGELVGNELKYRATGFDRKWHEYVARRVPDGSGNPPAPGALPALKPVASNGLAKTPPMGWNSWNKFQNRVTDKLVREMADVMVSSGMRDAGYVYLNIDDTWEGRRDPTGVLQPNQKFPDMKALAAYVHSRGLKLGIYSSPGPATCGGYEGSFGHEELDAKTWAAWGIDYLKYDWCSAGKIYSDQDLQAVYQIMGNALLRSGRPIVYSLCEYGKGDVWKWGAQVGGNLWRTTGDIGDSWKSMSQIGFDQGRLAPYAGPGHWNDPDMLEVGNGGMDTEEYRTHMSLWSMLSAPLLAGNDLRTMPPEIKSILLNREVIAIDQDPLGRQATRAWQGGDQEIWMKPLAGGAMALAVFNRGEAPVGMKLTAAELKLSSFRRARDLWADQEVHFDKGSFTATVPRHGVVLLRLE